MTSRPVKVLAVALGLSVILASGADAAKKAKKPHVAAPRATMSSAASCRRPDLFPCGPISFANQYLGEDPDPFIRSMIQRDLGAKFGDPD